MVGLREGSVPIFIQQLYAILQRVPRKILLTTSSSESRLRLTVAYRIDEERGIVFSFVLHLWARMNVKP